MRNFKKLPDSYIKKIKIKFDSLELVDKIEDGHGYEHISISCFDHWLTENEAKKLLDQITPEDKKLSLEKMYCFNKALIDSYEAINFRIRGRGGKKYIKYRGFSSNDDLIKYVAPSLHNRPSKFLFRLLLPEIGAIYYEGNDFTNHLYFKDINDVKKVKPLVDSCGLYILEDK